MNQAKFDDAVEELCEVISDYVKVKNPIVDDICQKVICRLAKEIVAVCEEDAPKKSEMPCNYRKCDIPETEIGKAAHNAVNALEVLIGEIMNIIEEKEQHHVQN